MKKLLRRVRFSVSVSALLTLVAGLLLTILTFVSVRQVESARQQTQFEQSAKLRATAIETDLHDAVEQLVVLNQLFRTFGVISREQFHTFTAPILKRYPEIQALSYQRMLNNADRPGFETEMQKRTPNFQLTEVVDGQQQRASIRDRYNVVDYIEPATGNESALGLDTAYTDDRTEARVRSRDTGAVISTGLLSLVQAKGKDTGFLVLAPVYWRGAPLDNVADRERAVIGEVSAVFRIDHLIDTILRTSGFVKTTGMTISIDVGDIIDPQHLAFRAGEKQSGDNLLHSATGWLFYDSAPPLEESFPLAGNDWHIQIVHDAVPFTHHNNGALFVLLAGMLSSLIAAGYVYLLVMRIVTIERDSTEHTSALQFANLRLSEDLTLHIRNEKSLRLREKVIEVSANAIVICSAQEPDYPIEYVNPAFERITGFSAEEVIGRNLDSLQGHSQDQQNIEEIRAALSEKREGHALLRNYRKDGSGYWNDLFIAPVEDENGVISHFVVAQYDITAVMHYEAEMEYQAHHDVLTGLANRNLLRERLTEAIAAAKKGGTPLWVVFIDLDRFKFVNDTLGHEAGDVLLKVLAARLKSATGDADTVARLGGDEFVLVLPDQREDAPGLAILQRIMDSIAQPLMLQDHEFFLTCSMGVATFPGDGNTAESLIKQADIAMYRSKEMDEIRFSSTHRQ